MLVTKAAETIALSPNDVLVQVVCALNTLPGEQAPVELKLYVNRLIYAAGSKIDDLNIDGWLSEGRILLSLIDFLQKDLSESALKAGIVPVPNPNPRASLGQDPQEQVDQLMAVVDKIKEINAPARVTVLASTNVYAGDRLSMSDMRFAVAK